MDEKGRVEERLRISRTMINIIIVRDMIQMYHRSMNRVLKLAKLESFHTPLSLSTSS